MNHQVEGSNSQTVYHLQAEILDCISLAALNMKVNFIKHYQALLPTLKKIVFEYPENTDELEMLKETAYDTMGMIIEAVAKDENKINQLKPDVKEFADSILLKLFDNPRLVLFYYYFCKKLSTRMLSCEPKGLDTI